MLIIWTEKNKFVTLTKDLFNKQHKKQSSVVKHPACFLHILKDDKECLCAANQIHFLHECVSIYYMYVYKAVRRIKNKSCQSIHRYLSFIFWSLSFYLSSIFMSLSFILRVYSCMFIFMSLSIHPSILYFYESIYLLLLWVYLSILYYY